MLHRRKGSRSRSWLNRLLATQMNRNRAFIFLGVLSLATLAFFVLKSGDKVNEAAISSDLAESGLTEGDAGVVAIEALSLEASTRESEVRQGQVAFEGSIGVGGTGSPQWGDGRKILYFRPSEAAGRSRFTSAEVQDDGSWSVLTSLESDVSSIRVGGCSIDGEFYPPEKALVNRSANGTFYVELHATPGTTVIPFSAEEPCGVSDVRLFTQASDWGSVSSTSPLAPGDWSLLENGFVAADSRSNGLLVEADGYAPTQLGAAQLQCCIVEPRMSLAAHLAVALIDTAGVWNGGEYFVSLLSLTSGSVAEIHNLSVGSVADFVPIHPGPYSISVFEAGRGATLESCAVDLGSVEIGPGELKFLDADLAHGSGATALISGRLELPHAEMDVKKSGFIRSRYPQLARAEDAFFFSMISPRWDRAGTTATWGPISVPACELDLRLPGGTSGFVTLSPGESREVVERLGIARGIQIFLAEGADGERVPAERVSYSRSGLQPFDHGGFAGSFELSVEGAGWVNIPEGDVWLQASAGGRKSGWTERTVSGSTSALVLPFRQHEVIRVIVTVPGLSSTDLESWPQFYPVILGDSGPQPWVASASPAQVIPREGRIELAYEVRGADRYLIRSRSVDGALPMPDIPAVLDGARSVEEVVYVFP